MTDLKWEEFDGHDVELIDFSKYDLVIGEKCWLMDNLHRKYVALAIAEARRRRYPK